MGHVPDMHPPFLGRTPIPSVFLPPYPHTELLPNTSPSSPEDALPKPLAPKPFLDSAPTEPARCRRLALPAASPAAAAAPAGEPEEEEEEDWGCSASSVTSLWEEAREPSYSRDRRRLREGVHMYHGVVWYVRAVGGTCCRLSATPAHLGAASSGLSFYPCRKRTACCAHD